MEGYRFENATIIKIMVLFAVKHMKRPVSNVEITDVLSDYANYFMIARAAGELAQTGLLATDGTCFTMTEQGEIALAGFGTEIPFSVREKILLALSSEQKAKTSVPEAEAEIERINEISYLVKTTLRQGADVLISVDINVGSRTTAEAMVKNFRRNPADIYDKIFAVLMEEQNGGKA